MKKAFLFVPLFILLIGPSIFLSAKVNNLTMNIQETEWRIEELKAENLKLRMDIQKLQTRESVLNRLEDDSLKYNPDNIIVIKND